MIIFWGRIINKNYNTNFKTTGFSVFCSFYGREKIDLVVGKFSLHYFCTRVCCLYHSSIIEQPHDQTPLPKPDCLGHSPLNQIFSSQSKGAVPQERKPVNHHRAACETLCILLLHGYQHIHSSLELQAITDLGPSRANSALKVA